MIKVSFLTILFSSAQREQLRYVILRYQHLVWYHFFQLDLQYYLFLRRYIIRENNIIDHFVDGQVFIVIFQKYF